MFLFNLPGVISAALNFLTPFLSSALGFAGWYFSNLWDGLKVILANLSTLTVIATIAIMSGLYGAHVVKCEPIAKEIVKNVPTFDWDKVFNGR